ncbi:MAG: alpha-1,2-fucosyltransferase [Bacteroides sp.]
MNVKRSLYKRMLKMKLMPPKVVTLMDGGICSQMHQFLLGQLFEERGFRVSYDLSFYEEWGSDLNDAFVRNFDLLKAFPYLRMNVASKMVIDVYEHRYYYKGNNTGVREEDFSFLNLTPPVYLGGYYHLPPELWLKTFNRLFRLTSNVLDETNETLRNEIQQTPHTIAVHVRRGDLKEEVFAYGKPATLTYFQKAVQLFMEKYAVPFFYFFSDEPGWVAQELIPSLPLVQNYKVIDRNGSDKGYMDLFLIASCRHQITSKGTLGKYGALLMDNPDKQVLFCNDPTEYPWKELVYNPVFI